MKAANGDFKARSAAKNTEDAAATGNVCEAESSAACANTEAQKAQQAADEAAEIAKTAPTVSEEVAKHTLDMAKAAQEAADSAAGVKRVGDHV